MSSLFYVMILALPIIACTNVSADTVLEPFTYHEDFESRTLGAWASYPLWQDTAYDPNFRVNEMVPGDPNISIEQKVTPYTNVDNYAGAQKLFDMYMIPGSTITFRYFLKTNLPVEFFKVRLAAGSDGKVDYTVASPPTNRWEWLTVSYTDYIRENPGLAGRDRIRVNALAVLAKIPDADPAMPVYLGLDDVTFKGARAMAFQFAEPEMYKLSEWKPYIPKKHYYKGDTFTLNGRWPLDASRVELTIAPFTDPSDILRTADLNQRGDTWTLKPFALSYDNGLYLNTLRAYRGKMLLSETQFTMHIAPKNIGGKHPRLWFDSETKPKIEARLKSDRFREVFDEIAENAARQRKQVPVETLVFDLDQFPDENWLPTWSAWGSHIYPTGEALFWNSLAYTFHGDRTAGEYAKDVLVKLAAFPNWTHPWQTKRGRFTEHRTGAWSHRLALAYDLTYDLMDETERKLIRTALMDYLVMGAHTTYVVNNNVTCNTSNWVAHIAGGSLMMQAAMFCDGADVEYLEPCFTGAAFKLFDMINKTTDPDGAWCEGLGYNNYTFRTLCESLPAVEQVFNIDMSKPLNGSYREYIWAGPVKAKKYYYYGDTGGNLNPIPSWAWLLEKNQDPLLGWYYNFLKFGDYESNTKDSIRSYMKTVEGKQGFADVLYDTENVPMEEPFGENPVRVFRGVGTTVFKGGWEPDDFIFVMRTGPFYNHQHIDQGSFWLSDRGSLFIEERHGSTYYDDPLYQPWYTQPVGHSTILIDGNHQSQRVGDHLVFAEGFEDYAHITHFLDGEHASFVSGDIGRLYFGKVESLTRNVLYLKPRTILMLDTAVPGDRDVDVTLLYQTIKLNDINANEDVSTITTDGNTLHIKHLYPEHMEITSVETPHYLGTLQNQRPLEAEGMLTVTARTAGNPLVMANLLTTTAGGEPDFTEVSGEGCLSGTADGIPFTFTTRPGSVYRSGTTVTDALAFTLSGTRLFAAMCTTLSHDGALLIESGEPVTCEISPDGIKYYHCGEGEVALGVPTRPASITVNGKTTTSFRYDSERKAIVLTLPAGEGMVRW